MKGIQSLHNWMSAQAKINPKLVNKKNIQLDDEDEQSVEVRQLLYFMNWSQKYL